MKQEEKTKKVNFNEIEIEQVDGKVLKINLKRQFANALYSMGKDLAVVELARKIWNSDDGIQIDEEEEKIILEYVPKIYDSYVTKNAIINSIK